MKQVQHVWEDEYEVKRFMTGNKPPKSILKFAKYLKKNKVNITESRVLDLGSGEGKNAMYLASLGAEVDCIEIAHNAVETAKNKAQEVDLQHVVRVVQGSIGEKYNFLDDTFEVILDVTSSNSLTERERETYLQESHRVLKPEGHMFVRALCKDGDHNAKHLLQNNPGAEYDTYTLPEWGLTERVFSESDLRTVYGKYFEIVHLEKETHYTTFDGRKYKRNFWIMYLQKK